MRVWNYIKETVSDHAMHFSLIDPTKQPIEQACKMAQEAEAAGTDLMLVGCSVGSGRVMDEYTKAIKSSISIPVVTFPNNSDSVSPEADAVLFLSQMNSRNTYWITNMPARMAANIHAFGVEPISTAYIIVEPGMLVGWVTDANALPRNKLEVAGSYALMAEYWGMKLFYFEAGSGAPEPVPLKMVRTARDLISIPIVVGGGIKTPEQAKQLVKAGADILVTGTALEETKSIAQTVSAIVNEMKKVERIPVRSSTISQF
jgi:phosphoglycerol geranylgeranyltransferase